MTMLKMALIAVALATSTPTAAQTATAPLGLGDMCPTIEKLAVTVMKARQAGVSMSKMMGIATTSDLARGMVLSAYSAEWPRYSSPAYQARAVQDFAATWSTVCWAQAEKSR